MIPHSNEAKVNNRHHRVPLEEENCSYQERFRQAKDNSSSSLSTKQTYQKQHLMPKSIILSNKTQSSQQSQHKCQAVQPDQSQHKTPSIQSKWIFLNLVSDYDSGHWSLNNNTKKAQTLIRTSSYEKAIERDGQIMFIADNFYRMGKFASNSQPHLYF